MHRLHLTMSSTLHALKCPSHPFAAATKLREASLPKNIPVIWTCSRALGTHSLQSLVKKHAPEISISHARLAKVQPGSSQFLPSLSRSPELVRQGQISPVTDLAVSAG